MSTSALSVNEILNFYRFRCPIQIWWNETSKRPTFIPLYFSSIWLYITIVCLRQCTSGVIRLNSHEMCTHRSTNIIFASHYEDPCSIPCQINSKLTHRSDRWPVAIKRGVTLKNYLNENHKKVRPYLLVVLKEHFITFFRNRIQTKTPRENSFSHLPSSGIMVFRMSQINAVQ
jgi:hypothetical protein